VEGCRACRAELAALVGTDEAVRRAVFALGEAAPPADYFDGLADRIAARIDAPEVIPMVAAAAAAVPREPTPKGTGRLGWILGGLAAASGAIGAALFVSLHWRAEKRPSSGATPAPAPAKTEPQPVAEEKEAKQVDQAAAPVASPPPPGPAPAEKPPPPPPPEKTTKPVVAARPDDAPAIEARPADKPAEMAKPGGVAPLDRDVARCWSKFRESGTVVVKVTVAEDGSVTDVTPEGTLGQTASGKCVAEAVRRARFEGETGTFRVTFTLPRK